MLAIFALATSTTAAQISSQQEALQLGEHFAKSVGVEPRIVKAILLQESLAGNLPNFRQAKSNYGIGQVKTVAAKQVFIVWPQMKEKYSIKSDAELVQRLRFDDHFNIDILAHYVKYLQTAYGFVGNKLLNAYNRGPAGVARVSADFYYAREALAKVARLQ